VGQEGRGGNGEFELKLPVGGFRLAGRDLLLAAVLMALGVGAIGVQYLSLQEFRHALVTDHARLLVDVDEARAERRHLLGLMRLQVCTSETWARSGSLSDAARTRVSQGWGAYCLDAQAEPVGPPKGR
jgi:hypothetical protein